MFYRRTFNIPNGNNKSLWGNTLSATITSGAPNITGLFFSRGMEDSVTASGACYGTGSYTRLAHNTSSAKSSGMGFDASKSNSIYGATTYIRPQSLGIKYIIRY